MKFIILLTILVSACTLASCKPGKLPAKWKTCKKNDPKLQECFKEAMADAVLGLVDGGEPSLGVFTIDPLRMTKLSLAQGSGPVSIDLEFRNLDMKGVGSSKFTNAHFDPKTYEMSVSVALGKPLLLDGDYTIRGRVLLLPITGEGKCSLRLDDATLTVTQKGVPVKRGAETYLNVTDFSFKLDTKKLHLHFDNLFNGNKELGATMNTFLNENSAEVLTELKPAISDGFGEVFRQISNRVFSKIPLDKIFPEK